MAAGSQAIVPTLSQIDAAIPGTLDEILIADPVDLALHMEQVWDLANVWAPSTRPVGKGRRALIELGAFNDLDYGREERPRVVFCTTENSIDHIRAAIEAGADEYVMKPFDRETLEGKLQLVGVA